MMRKNDRYGIKSLIYFLMIIILLTGRDNFFTKIYLIVCKNENRIIDTKMIDTKIFR